MHWRPAGLVLCVIVLTACTREGPRQETAVPDSATAADSSTTVAPGALARLAILDDSARRLPTDPRVPGWLYAAGVEGAQHSFFDPTTAADSANLARLPEAYYLNEIAGSHTYTGWHLTELVRRFPTHSLADDAGFLVAQHYGFVAGECEGMFFCQLAVSVDPYARFLRSHPSSPLVAAALAAIDSAARSMFDEVEGGRLEFMALDSMVRDTAQQRHQVVSVERTLQEFEEAARALPATSREQAMAILEAIRARWARLRDRP